MTPPLRTPKPHARRLPLLLTLRSSERCFRFRISLWKEAANKQRPNSAFVSRQLNAKRIGLTKPCLIQFCGTQSRLFWKNRQRYYLLIPALEYKAQTVPESADPELKIGL